MRRPMTGRRPPDHRRATHHRRTPESPERVPACRFASRGPKWPENRDENERTGQGRELTRARAITDPDRAIVPAASFTGRSS